MYGECSDFGPLVMQEFVENWFDGCKKVLPVFFLDGLCLRQFYGARISVHAIQAVLIMQMVRRGQTGAAHEAYRLSLSDAFSNAGGFRETRHMGVQRRDVATVLQDDRVAIAALHAAEYYLAIPGCHY